MTVSNSSSNSSDGSFESPWLGDACSLVESYRAKKIRPYDVLLATIEAIKHSSLNAFCYIDEERALSAASRADPSLPFGGVPIGIKELEPVKGWPFTQASLLLAEQVATYTATMVSRLEAAGGILIGQTTASEFGSVNYTSTRLHGTTRNPWDLARTPGGSSGGSAAAVAGGLVPLASGSDGGGSIRIPAGFCGLLGLKPTYGRIPRGPSAEIYPLFTAAGCLSRSVRDTARWLDVCNGYDSRDPLSLPRVDNYEQNLGSFELRGRKAAIVADLGTTVINSRVADAVTNRAEQLAKETGLRLVSLEPALPKVGVEWVMASLVTALAGPLAELYPERAEDLGPEMQLGLDLATHQYGIEQAAAMEAMRRRANEAMADIFDKVDFLFCATNPDVAFTAEGPMPTTIEDRDLVATLGFEAALANNATLTIPANLTGNPAISIPAGSIDGLPIGIQVIGDRHRESLLLELAAVAERMAPWPLAAPSAPC